MAVNAAGYDIGGPVQRGSGIAGPDCNREGRVAVDRHGARCYRSLEAGPGDTVYPEAEFQEVVAQQSVDAAVVAGGAVEAKHVIVFLVCPWIGRGECEYVGYELGVVDWRIAMTIDAGARGWRAEAEPVTMALCAVSAVALVFAVSSICYFGGTVLMVFGLVVADFAYIAGGIGVDRPLVIAENTGTAVKC
jgi:hypothetical protein